MTETERTGEFFPNIVFFYYRKIHGNPRPAEGLRKARLSVLNVGGDRESAPNYVIWITSSMREESEAIEEANKLKQAGTKIIAVGKNFSAIVSRSTMKK